MTCCNICLIDFDDFDNSDDLNDSFVRDNSMILTPCNHSFHLNCIKNIIYPKIYHTHERSHK